jgi:hypothetical protein
MTPKHPTQGVPWLGADFFENQHNFPPEELAKYEDLHIAWSWDGTRILASAPSREELNEELKRAGIDPGRVVHDYIPPLDQSQLLWPFAFDTEVSPPSDNSGNSGGGPRESAP